MSSAFTIGFMDNTVHHIFRSFEELRGEFPRTHLFSHEQELFDFLSEGPLDLVMVNLDLAPNDAIHLLKELRAMPLENQPFVVIYSLKQDDFIQELALNAGADAFINFHRKPLVLKHFVRNMLTRRSTPETTKLTRELVLDREQYLVYRNGVPHQLPRKEFLLFELLYSGGRFFSKTEIAGEIWKDEKIATKRIIDVHIYNIRQFLGKRVIQSQKGKGYRINSKLISAAAFFAALILIPT